MMVKKKTTPKPNPHAPRPYETDYSGAWKGHCKSVLTATDAAHRHLIRGEYSRCTVTGPEGVVARLHWTPMGVLTISQPIVAMRNKVKLKVVK